MKKVNIIVADDIASDNEMVREALEEYAGTRPDVRIHIDAAFDGDEAINIMREYEEEGTPLHLLVTDQKMPHKKGNELIEYMRSSEHLRYVPAIVLSTSNNQRDVDACWLSGGHGYLEKPESWKEYQDLVVRLAEFWLGDVLYPSRKVTTKKKGRLI